MIDLIKYFFSSWTGFFGLLILLFFIFISIAILRAPDPDTWIVRTIVTIGPDDEEEKKKKQSDECNSAEDSDSKYSSESAESGE